MNFRSPLLDNPLQSGNVQFSVFRKEESWDEVLAAHLLAPTCPPPAGILQQPASKPSPRKNIDPSLGSAREPTEAEVHHTPVSQSPCYHFFGCDSISCAYPSAYNLHQLEDKCHDHIKIFTKPHLFCCYRTQWRPDGLCVFPKKWPSNFCPEFSSNNF